VSLATSTSLPPPSAGFTPAPDGMPAPFGVLLPSLAGRIIPNRGINTPPGYGGALCPLAHVHTWTARLSCSVSAAFWRVRVSMRGSDSRSAASSRPLYFPDDCVCEMGSQSHSGWLKKKGTCLRGCVPLEPVRRSRLQSSTSAHSIGGTSSHKKQEKVGVENHTHQI
jgi:hypothetical protein